MQGLRPLQAHQDENGGLAMRGPVAGKLLAGGDENGAISKSTPMPSARKALGNITNRGLDASNILPGKAGGLGSVVRKPLGGTLQPRLAAPPQTESAAEERVRRLAQDGVEQLAGKGWKEQGRDREAREDEEISRRLAAFAALGRHNLPSFYPHWTAATSVPVMQQEDVAPTLPSPVKQPKTLSLALDIFEDDFGDACLPSLDGEDGTDDFF